jgi:hypothetical protein
MESFTSNGGLLIANKLWCHNLYKGGNGIIIIIVSNEVTQTKII